MTMKIKETGCDELMAQLRYVAGKVPDNARKVMRRQADKIVKLAQLYAPYKDGDLEESIHKEIGYEDNGRLKIDIVAGGIVNGVDVDTYAVEMEENYESMTPGPGTIAKREANPGVYVGGKFMERALNDSATELTDRLLESVIATTREIT
jgi:hypothetical protein